MAKERKKRGLPKNLEEAIDRREERPDEEKSMGEFIMEMHGDAPAPLPLDEEGWPTKEWLQTQFTTKSAIIRYLVSQDRAVKDIARKYGFKYQMVRNISTNPLKRGPNEDWRKPYLDQTNVPDIKTFKTENKTKP